MDVYDQPVTMNGKVYMRGNSNGTHTMLVYTPDQEHWGALPPPVTSFTVATLRGQLLVVGGQDKSTHKKTNTILTFDESSRQWLQSLPPMPVAVTFPAVVEYQDHLIIAGGRDSNGTRTTDVNILDTTTNKWTAAEPLPKTDLYNTCLIGDTLYLVGSATGQVVRANVPSLISRASSGVWETVANVPLYHSSLVTVGNTLLAVGGSDEPIFGVFNTDIYLYDHTKDQWTKCGDLPEPMDCYCTVLSDKVYVFGSWLSSSSVYISTLSITQ